MVVRCDIIYVFLNPVIKVQTFRVLQLKMEKKIAASELLNSYRGRAKTSCPCKTIQWVKVCGSSSSLWATLADLCNKEVEVSHGVLEWFNNGCRCLCNEPELLEKVQSFTGYLDGLIPRKH